MKLYEMKCMHNFYWYMVMKNMNSRLIYLISNGYFIVSVVYSISLDMNTLLVFTEGEGSGRHGGLNDRSFPTNNRFME